MMENFVLVGECDSNSLETTYWVEHQKLEWGIALLKITGQLKSSGNCVLNEKKEKWESSVSWPLKIELLIENYGKHNPKKLH